MRTILLFMLLAIPVVIQAQDFDRIVERNPYISCEDVRYNAPDIIERYYNEQKLDSTYQFIEYWESKCGLSEPKFRLRTLLDIQSGTFTPDSISKEWISQLEWYKQVHDGGSFRFTFFFHGPIDLVYRDEKVDSLSRVIASETDAINIDARLFVDFYSKQEPAFEKIRQQDATQSRLKYFYDMVYTEVYNEPQGHYALIAGAARHYDDLSVFGTRPSIGLMVGSKKLRNNFDLIFDIRIGPSKESYTFINQDEEVTHKEWSSLYLGFEYTYDFIRHPKFDLGFSPGMGLDRITLKYADSDDDEDAKFAHSLNLNTGLVLKYYLKNSGHYVGMQARYNWLDYQNIVDNNLLGEIFSFRISFGVINNHYRNQRLKRLE